MNEVGQALTRKLGPFPVWVWAIIVGTILYVIRQRAAKTTASTGNAPSVEATQAEAQLLTAEAQAIPQSQPPIPLAAGESIYDPNTGVLMGGNGNNPLATDILGIIAALLFGKPNPRGQQPHHKMRTRSHSQVHGEQASHPGHHQPKHPPQKSKSKSQSGAGG